MLNWIVWNRKVFDNKTLCKEKTILILKCIVWNKTAYMHKYGLTRNDLQWFMCHKPNQTKPKLWKLVCLYKLTVLGVILG